MSTIVKEKTNSKKTTSARKPFKHQIEAADFLVTKKKAILAHEMGAGKTASSIIAMNKLKGKKLIVCPASLKLNWKKEIKLFSTNEIEIVNSGDKWKKVKKDDWVIINYDILKNYINEIKKEKFKVVTFDEAHYCKSINNNGHGGSKRARSFIQISNQIEYVFLLSGTPITNKTKDIFNLLKAIKHPLSRNFKDFAKQYCNPQFNGYGWSYDGSSNQEELNEKLKSHMLRKTKEEILDLPKKTRNFIPVEINTKEYQKELKKYLNVNGKLKNKNEHLVYLNAMRHTLAKEKVHQTKKFVENLLEQNRPVVIFTNYTYVIERLKEAFPESVTITGRDNKEEREKAVQDFQKGKTNIILCNLIAGGVGITLTRAKNMIINDLDWNPANHLQSEDRIHRIGQNESVVIDYLYSEGTIDEKMTQMLEEKLLNINKIIDDKEEGFVEGIINWFKKKSSRPFF